MKMDFYSKLFCFTATTIMLIVVVIVEKSNDNRNASPSPSMMIGWQPMANRIDDEDPHGYHFRKIIERIEDDEDEGSGSGDYAENDDSHSKEYDVDPNEYGARGTENFMLNRQQALVIMLDLDKRCKSLIAKDENQCFSNYFVPYGNMDEIVFTNDPKSDFNRKACCSMWKWFDCTRIAIKRECDDIALRSFETRLKQVYVYTTYCVNYEYGTDACAPLTVWMFIAFATLAIMVIVGTCLSVALVLRCLHAKHEERERRSGQSYDVPDAPDVHEEFEL